MTLLRRILTRRRPELLAILDDIGRNTIKLAEEDRETLREVVADELAEVGLDPEDEPTPHGLRLEEIIDWLGRQ